MATVSVVLLHVLRPYDTNDDALRQDMHMPALPRSNIHLDILMGRDEALDVSEVFLGICSIFNSEIKLILVCRTGEPTTYGYSY